MITGLIFLPALAALFSLLVCYLDWDYRRFEAKWEAKALADRKAAYANRARTIATLERFATNSEARGYTIDARNFRNRAARLSAWQGEDGAYIS